MNRLKNTDRVLAVLAALLIATYFFRLTRPALHNYYTADDYQNLWRAWFFPLRDLIKANFLFFGTSVFIRPMVSNWCRVILWFSGMNPYWLRAANLAVLMGNILLTYALARRLSASREIAVVAALLFSYSRPMNYLYFDTGFTCDVLCCFFYFSTILFYIRIRQQERLPRAWEMALACMLYICALNSKEMAVTLPGILALYELLRNPPASWRPREFLRYALREGRGALITGAIVLLFVLGRSLGPGSLLQFAEYRPVFTWQRFMLTNGSFFSFVSGRADPWNLWAVAGIWIAMCAVAWFSRLRALRFAWLFIVLSSIPIDFILPRGPQNYIPWFGWMFLAAIVLVQAVAWITERVWAEQPLLSRVRGAALLLLLVFILYPHYKRQGWHNVNSIYPESFPLRDAAFELHGLEPTLKPEARILLMRDPIFTGHTLDFIVLMAYRDRSLDIFNVKTEGRKPTEAEMARFDYIFDYRRGHYVELRGSHPTGEFVVEPIRIDSLQPDNAGVKMPFNAQPDGQAALAVFGKNIPGGSTILWDDQPLQTAVGPTFAAAVVPGELYAKPGKASITIRDGEEGLISNALDFTIYPNEGPDPKLAALYPGRTAPGKSFNPQPAGDSALGIGGEDFLPGVTVFFDRTRLTTTFGKPTSISAIVPPALIVSAGAHQVWAVNPDGKESRPLVFSVTEP
jgi:hypothetical protein